MGRAGEANIGSVLAVVCIITSFGLLTSKLIYNHYNKNTEQEKPMEQAVLEYKVASDIGVDSFSLYDLYFLNDTEKDDYLVLFTGSATNLNGDKIEFVSADYSVSMETFNEMKAYISNHQKSDYYDKEVFKLLLENIRSLRPTHINGINKDESTVVKSVTKPRINKEEGYAYYDVEFINYDKENSNSLEIVKNRVFVELDDKLMDNPFLVYLASKNKAMVKTISKTNEIVAKRSIVKFSR